jgi:hypothetical protein
MISKYIMDYLLTDNKKEQLNTCIIICKTLIIQTKLKMISFYETNQQMIDFWSIGLLDIISGLLGLLLLVSGGLLYSMYNMINSLWSYTMEKTNRKRIIMDRVNDEPYLERYYIFLKDRSENFPFNIFIHKFLKSDPDELHDHPWGFFTFILSGGYWEYTDVTTVKKDENGVSVTETNIVKYWRGPGFFQKVSANHKHRVELKEDVNAWTLFIPFKRQREWGFFTDDGWVTNETYLENKQKEHQNKKEE